MWEHVILGLEWKKARLSHPDDQTRKQVQEEVRDEEHTIDTHDTTRPCRSQGGLLCYWDLKVGEDPEVRDKGGDFPLLFLCFIFFTPSKRSKTQVHKSYAGSIPS